MTAFNSFAVQTKAQQARQLAEATRSTACRRWASRAASSPTATSPTPVSRRADGRQRAHAGGGRRPGRPGPPGQPEAAERAAAPVGSVTSRQHSRAALGSASHRMACKFRAAMRTAFPCSLLPLLPCCRSPLRSRSLWPALLALRACRPRPRRPTASSRSTSRPTSPAQIDLLNQVVVFNGNVVVTKGTMVIRAARIEVRETPDGYHTAVAIGSPAQPATFRQKRDGVDEYIEGEAERLEYDGKADIIRFVNSASVRRLRGARPADEITGNLDHLRQHDRGVQRLRRRAGDRGEPGRPRPRGADAQGRHAPRRAEAARGGERRRPSAPARSQLTPRARGAAMTRGGRRRAAARAPARGAAACRSRTARAWSSRTCTSRSRSGEVVGLLGPNGAGKTTSFYMIVGLVRADAGEITIEGQRVERLPIHQRSRLGLSYLPQEASIFRKLTVEENIRAVLELQFGADGKAAEAGGDRRAARTACCTTCPSRSCATRRRRRCRAASGAGSRSRARWRPSRASSCSTSRSPASTRSR